MNKRTGALDFITVPLAIITVALFATVIIFALVMVVDWYLLPSIYHLSTKSQWYLLCFIFILFQILVGVSYFIYKKSGKR